MDPITASIIQGALDNIALEMGAKLMRMAHSSIIRESEDFGAALCDAQGRQLCECAMSTPLQSGPIPGYVRGILKLLAGRGQSLEPGDVIIHNDPYHGASHSPDIGICVPVFTEGRLVAFSMTTAHHLDIGSSQPGTCGISECVDTYAEGLQLRALKVYEQGRRNATVWQLLRDNVRVPDLVIGDLEAQVAAAQIGGARFSELLAEYGEDTLNAAVLDLFDHAEQLMRAQIARIPDGTYEAVGHVDGMLGKNDPALQLLPVKVTITVAGAELTVDFAGTAPQLDHYSLNMPFVGTVDVAVWLALRSVLLDTEIHGKVPQNHGLYRPIHIKAPQGCLANPTFPAPTMSRACTGNIVADTVIRALAPVMPEQICAGIAGVKAIVFSATSGEQPWVHIEIFEGSYGGRFGKDGMDSVDTLYANTRNNPVEDIETHTPLRVTRYELRTPDACAAGRWRGGCNSVKEIEMLADGFIAIEGDGHAHRAWGFDSGEEGLLGRAVLTRANGERVELPSMLAGLHVKKGDRVTVIGGTGGGFGSAPLRDAERVMSDVLDGIIGVEQAAEVYRVAITPDHRVDATATQVLRAHRLA
ncbi:MAG: hydantoinase B/oxoprolinase family protein [Steroidobacteraceae bacterium]